MTERLTDEEIEALIEWLEGFPYEKEAGVVRQLLEERRLMKRPVKTSTDTGPLQKSSWHISRWVRVHRCPRCNARVAPQDGEN